MTNVPDSPYLHRSFEHLTEQCLHAAAGTTDQTFKS